MNLEQTILENTKYVRGFQPEDEDAYVLSASMVAKEPLQNYLTIIHGTEPETKISDATLGSVFHKGMEEILLNEKKNNGLNVEVEKSFHKKLKNGWYISGTADLVELDDNGKIETIEDHKLTKTYALKMIKQNVEKHDYAIQLKTLDWLTANDQRPGNARLFINVFCKDAKAIDMEPSFEQVKVKNLAGLTEYEQKLEKITSELQEYIESGEIPPKCGDVWERKLKNGTVIPTKCALYCSHGKAGNCPYYEANTRTTVNRLTNW